MRYSPSTVVGQTAELRFQLYCLSKGYDVCKPVFECTKGYDYLVDFGDGFKRVQVKSAYLNFAPGDNTYYQVHNGTTSSRGTKHAPYPKGSYDVLAVLASGPDRMWLFPADVTDGKTFLTYPLDGIWKKSNPKRVDWTPYEVT